MEEQLTPLLIKTIENNQTFQIDINILENYYELFDSKKYLGNDFEEIYNKMKETYSIDLQSLRYGYNNQDEQGTYQNLIIAVINETDAKKKKKLIPLIIYLDNDRFFYDYLYKIKYFDNFVYEIKDFFIDTIKGSGVKISNIEELPDYHQEKEWFENYKKGIESLNFKQIYSFVEGVERGMGHRFDIYVDFLIFIAYKYFFNDLVKIANNKKHMFEIIYLIHVLNIKETLILANQSSNYLLKFEAIKKSVYFKTNNQYCLNLLKDEQEFLKDIIFEFSKDSHLWQEFLDFYLIYPLRNPQLFRPLSKVVSLVKNDKIDILIQSIKVDRFISDDSKEALNSCFLQIENDEIREYCLKSLFEIWIDFIDGFDDYFSSIILTDIIDIVIVYVRDFLDKDIIIKDVTRILHQLDEIDNAWFKDNSEQNNCFYKQMSKLFVYGFSFEKHKISELQDRVKNICITNPDLKTEAYHDTKTTLQLFDEYILKEKIVK